MSSQRALFASPHRQVGPHERSLTTSLREWRKLRHLDGPANAARRALLRELARDVDAALSARNQGDVSPYSYAVTAATYRAALDAYAPPLGAPRDVDAEQLAAAADQIIAQTLAGE